MTVRINPVTLVRDRVAAPLVATVGEEVFHVVFGEGSRFAALFEFDVDDAIDGVAFDLGARFARGRCWHWFFFGGGGRKHCCSERGGGEDGGGEGCRLGGATGEVLGVFGVKKGAIGVDGHNIAAADGRILTREECGGEGRVAGAGSGGGSGPRVRGKIVGFC